MKKKPGIEIVLGMGKPKGMPKEEGEEHEGGYGEEHRVMAEEMLDAIKAGDADALAQAFKGLFHACESEPHEEYNEE